jgi:hypothetical protein
MLVEGIKNIWSQAGNISQGGKLMALRSKSSTEKIIGER